MRNLIFFAAVFAAACSWDYQCAELSAEEKDMLFTINDLNAFGFRFPEGNEGISCVRSAVRIPFTDFYPRRDYQYTLDRSNVPADEAPLLISNAVSLSDPLSSRTNAFLVNHAMKFGLGQGGVTVEDTTGFKTFADNYQMKFLKYGTEPVGNWITFTDGRISYSLIISGAHISDPASWDPFFEKELTRIRQVLQ